MVPLLTKSPWAKSCLFFFQFRKKTNFPPAKLICQRYLLPESRLETVIILLYTYFFNVILVHSFFVIFLNTQYYLTKKLNTTDTGIWFVSIKRAGYGIQSKKNHEDIKRRRIPTSRYKCYGLILVTSGTGEVCPFLWRSYILLLCF